MLGGGEECCFSSFNLAEDPFFSFFVFISARFNNKDPAKYLKEGCRRTGLTGRTTE